MQERRNSIAYALELRLFCTNPSIWSVINGNYKPKHLTNWFFHGSYSSRNPRVCPHHAVGSLWGKLIWKYYTVYTYCELGCNLTPLYMMCGCRETWLQWPGWHWLNRAMIASARGITGMAVNVPGITAIYAGINHWYFGTCLELCAGKEVIYFRLHS